MKSFLPSYPGLSLIGTIMVHAGLFATLLLLPEAGAQTFVTNWQQTSEGTFDWGTGGNWSNGLPNSTGASANLDRDLQGNVIINLNGSRTLGALVIGDNAGSVFTYSLNAGSVPGSILVLGNTVFAPFNLEKSNTGGTDSINVPVHANSALRANIASGTLLMAGGLNLVGGSNQTLQKFGGATLTISGPLTVPNSPGKVGDTSHSILMENNGNTGAGTLNIAGATNTIANGVLASTGTINFGSTASGVFNTTFTALQGLLTLNPAVNTASVPFATAVNFGVNAGTGVVANSITNNVTIDMDRINILGGTLNLRNGNSIGTTTLAAGATNTLTLNGGTTTFFTTGGGAAGSVNIAAGAKLVMNGGAVLNFSSTANVNMAFGSINSTSNTAILRSQAGNGTLTVGGDGVADVWNGQINLSGSGGNSRLIKVGTETLTIAGNRDNVASRIDVQQGTVILAKDSSALVASIGSSLIIGTGSGSEKIVQIGGTFNSAGNNIPSNFNDQIFRSAVVTINNDGVLDLNGSIESIDYVLGTGLITNRAAATLSTLIVGDNNFAFEGRTFAGTIQDGAAGARIGFVKTGDQTLTLTNGGSTFTGPSIFARGTTQLSGNGAFTGTETIGIERLATLLLNNDNTTVANRINNSATVAMNRGTLTLRGGVTANPNKVILEALGNLSLSSFNVVRLDNTGAGGTVYVPGSNLELNFAGYGRNPGGQVAFVEQSSSDANAGFLSANPAGSTSKITLGSLPTSLFVGGGNTSFTPQTSVLIGAFGGARGNASTDFMTIQTFSNVNYVRPLRTSEMNTSFNNLTVSVSNLPVSLPAAPTATWNQVVQLSTNLAFNINANLAFNAIRFDGTSNIYIADDRKWILGGMGANANLGTIGFDGSGMMAFNSGAVSTFGGTIAFGAREAIMRVGGSTHSFRSVIEGTGGLSKSGGTRLDLMGQNTYTGGTWVHEGEIRGYTNTAFGIPGPNNEVMLNIANLGLQSGVVIGDGTPSGSSRLYVVGAGSTFNSYDQNNVWGGDVFISATNAGGQSGQNVTMRAIGNAIMTLNGMVTGAGADSLRNLSENNPTQNFTGSGQGLFLENNLSGVGGGIFYLNGGLSDREGQAAAGTGIPPSPGIPALSAEHEKLNLFVRGFTGQASLTNSEFVVNIKDASKVNGRIDLRSGLVFIDSDYGTGGRGDYVRGALLRLSDGGNVDRAGIMAGLLMTQPGTTFRGNDIQIGVNDGSHSSNSMALLGGLNRSGQVVIGSDRGTLDLNPVAGSSNFTSVSTVQANAGSSTLTLDTGSSGVAANIRVGFGITGTGIVPGTIVLSINGNVVTLSQPTTELAGIGTSYTLGYFPSATNIGATTNLGAAFATNDLNIRLASIEGFTVGRGISGPGIPAGTVIDAVNPGTNTITLRLHSIAGGSTTGINALDSVYTAYDISNTITVNIADGLKVGMGLVATGVPSGATITGISGNTITLSTPLNSAMPLGTSLSFPLTRVNYQTVATPTVAGANASGGNTLQLFSVTGLTIGSTVSGTGIATGTTITAINPTTNVVTLSRPLTAANNNSGIAMMKSANFVESRLYAAPGGTVDFRMRVTEDGSSFGLNNEVGAISKVGRGTVELSGSAAGGSDLDGGLNLFGGTLVFDYINLQNEEGVALARDNSRISQGIANSPVQFTLGGGKLIFRDGDGAGITENMRGTFTVRAGNSQIVGQAGNTSSLILNLGYNNPFLSTDSRYQWRSPDRFAGGTFQLEYANLIDPNDVNNFGGTVRVQYSQNAFIGGIDGRIGDGTIIPYATMRFNEPFLGEVVDFASFQSDAQTNGTTNTLFADASGSIRVGNLFDISGVGGNAFNVGAWNNAIMGNQMLGYIADNYLGQMDVGGANGFTGTLTPNAVGGDFRGARAIRYTSNAANNTINLGSTRLVLGTSHPDDASNPSGIVEDGGAILISNLVSVDVSLPVNSPDRIKPRDQFISGGSLTSAVGSTYFTSAVMPGPLTYAAKPAATSTDLIIHNYNDHGVFTIQSQIVNFQPSLPLNLVVSGTGVTKLAPTAGAGNTFTGGVYINDGTLWVANTSALGAAASTAMIYMNGGILEIADLNASIKEVTSLNRTLPTARPLVIGGDGATIKTTAAGTVVTFGGIVRAEDNIIPLNLIENQYSENMGVGDLIKSGQGRLILTNSTRLGTTGWNAFFGVTEVLAGTLQLNIANINSGILGSHYSHLDGTRIESGGRVELNITGATFGTDEWFDLLGGVLATGATHTDGILDGVIRFSNDSEINVSQGTLRLNSNAGNLEGSGRFLKTGAGTLVLGENNANFSGAVEIRNGLVIGASQGAPLGVGAGLVIGDESSEAAGETGVLLQSRTTDGIFRSVYSVKQAIEIRSEGGGLQQNKVLGARNLIGTGVQNDLYLFEGEVTLLDDLVLRYQDEATNIRINSAASGGGATSGNLFGGNRTIALRGNLLGGGNLRTEVIQTGGTINGSDPDQIITFELGGNNSAWTGTIRLGNSAVDADRQHILRASSSQALNSGNRVTLDFNSTLQLAGQALTIGNLIIGLPTGSAATNGVFVENAANAPGTLIVNQTVNEVWDVIFRDGVTPTHLNSFDAAVRNNALNLVKTGRGVATMTQVNTYTGSTQIGTSNGLDGGTLRLVVGGAISPESALNVMAGAFEMVGVNHTLNQALNLGGGAAGTRALIRTGLSTLTLNNNVVYNNVSDAAGAEITGTVQMGASPRTFTVADSIGAAIDLDVRALLLGTSGSSMVKSGPGTMSLAGSNTFTGGVSVSQGTLLANNTAGSATGAGIVNVQPGATLGGVGTISGDVNLIGGVGPGQGATLMPGSPLISSGIEVLNLTATLTLGEHAMVEFYLGQTGFTKLNLGTLGNVAATTRFKINFDAGYTPSAGAEFDLIDWVNYTNTLDTNWVDNLILPSGVPFLVSDFSTTGILRISGTAQPVAFISQPAQARTVDPGTQVQFQIQLTGTDPWIIQWKKNNVNIPGANGLSYTIPFALEVDEANYSVEVRNSVNTLFSTYDYALVVNDFPVILNQPVGGTINPGAGFTLTVVAAGADSFEWRRNGQPIIGATTDTYEIESATEADQGTYTVVLSNPKGSVTSNPALLMVNDPVVFVGHPQNFDVPTDTTVTFSVNVSGTAPLSYQWRLNGINIPLAINPTLTVTATTGVNRYSVRVSNIASPGGVVSNEGTLTVVPAPVSFRTQPEPQIVPVGGTLTLSCRAVGAVPLKYQWRRNGVNIAGATNPTLVIPNVSTARAGSYTCFASNSIAGVGPSSKLSDPVQVAVVNTSPRRLVLKRGASTTLSVTAAGTVTYEWFKDDGSGEAPANRLLSTLPLTNLQVSDSMDYYCRVTLTGTSLTLDGGRNSLTVFSERPALDKTNWSFKATTVSELYSDQVRLLAPTAADQNNTPTSFRAVGLPAGLKIDSSGLITGRATAVRRDRITQAVIPYEVTITATNSFGSDTVERRELMVSELPVNVIGVFAGPVERNPALTPPATGFVGINFGLGGRIDVTTTKTGTFTGRLTLGATVLSFKGALNSDLTNISQPKASVVINRSKMTPLTLTFTLDAPTNRLIEGLVTDGTATAKFHGWRNVWSKGTPATAYEKYYTFDLVLPPEKQGMVQNPGIPQGIGFGSFTVAPATGNLSLSGRLSDNTVFTSASFVGPAGEVLVFRTLYAANARGSILGQVKITLGGSNPFNTVSAVTQFPAPGDEDRRLTWWRPATPGTTGRIYAAGFDPLVMSSEGSRYDPPPTGSVVMDATSASINFFEAGVETAQPPTNFVSMTIASNHRVTFVSENRRNVTLTINPRTGTLTGRFSLLDDHPEVNPSPRPKIARTVSFFGLIVRDQLKTQGVGSFMLPQLPATRAISASRTPILSGQVFFDKIP